MLIKSKKLNNILENAYNDKAPGKPECKFMLEFEENSIESGLIRAAADDIMRRKSENSAILLGQIGIDVSPCPGGCKFCSFGEDNTSFVPEHMSLEKIKQKTKEFTNDGDLYGLYLMAMHDYKLERLLDAVNAAYEEAPSSTQIWVNVGDSSKEAFQEMKKAGVTGVYHVCRINEGIDTKLNPKDRIQTMDNALEAGLELYTCCEPIGPEHTVDQLVDNMFIGIEKQIYQHAAMRRVAVPGTPLAKHGQISELRLAQIVAVISLASMRVDSMAYMGVHEPNELGYTSGANIITAESGVNPRDIRRDTSRGRGFDLDACRRMLIDCGFRYLKRGDESKIELTQEYVNGLIGV